MLYCLPGHTVERCDTPICCSGWHWESITALLTQLWDQFKESLATVATRQSRAWRKSRSPLSLAGETDERVEDKCRGRWEFISGDFWASCRGWAVSGGEGWRTVAADSESAESGPNNGIHSSWGSWAAARHSRAPLSNSCVSPQCIMTGDSWGRGAEGCRARTVHGQPVNPTPPNLSVAARRGRTGQTPACSLFMKDVAAG